MDTSSWISLIFSLFGVILVYFGFINKHSERIATLEGKAKSMEKKTEDCPNCKETFLELGFKMDVLWKNIEPALARIIHSPTHKRRDELVDGFLSRRLVAVELEELAHHLALNVIENDVNIEVFCSGLLRANVQGELSRVAPFLKLKDISEVEV